MTSAIKPHRYFNSLRTRIMVSALLIIVLVLPSIGIALNNAFEQQIRANVQDELNAYFYSVLALTEIEDGELVMPEALLDNQFNVINSGLYALITYSKSPSAKNESPVMWFSNSFLGADIAQSLPAPDVGESLFTQVNVNDEAHFMYSFSVRFDTTSKDDEASLNSAPITLHIIKDTAGVLAQQKVFSQVLWTWILVLIAALLLIQFFWLAWTLKPLSIFSRELNAVQKGEAEQLAQHYPSELHAVAMQLNTLLRTEQQQRKRYRNALSDLAHSLKTPLAIIQSQKDLSASSMEQVMHINQIIGHQLKRAQHAGQSAWHLGIDIHFTSDKLLRTLAKIHPSIDLRYGREPSADCTFFGDESDLTEMLGNLLDNACKAAKSKVELSVFLQEKQLFIVVEDDGKGISEANKLKIIERGKRADTYEQGHGIGLAIVRDLVDSYEGKISIEHSDRLGGAKFIISFLQN